jgi:DNA ligase D-like protein (predicted 3'-phosphoesterase)
VSYFGVRSKYLIHSTFSRFVIHQHKTGRSHYDLRIVQKGMLRSWSLLKEPPLRPGERRLAVERENFSVESLNSKKFEEEAFGQGRIIVWDEGGVEVKVASPRTLVIRLMGNKVMGTYEFRKMIWYPGNRWLLTKLRIREPDPNKDRDYFSS